MNNTINFCGTQSVAEKIAKPIKEKSQNQLKKNLLLIAHLLEKLLKNPTHLTNFQILKICFKKMKF